MKLPFLPCLIALHLLSFSNGDAQSFHIRKEYRTDCNNGNKTLMSVEEYNQKGKIVKSTRQDRKRSTEYFYNNNDQIILKIHRDSTGKVSKFNRLSYIDGKLSTDTLFNTDSTVNMIFSSRFSAKKREQKIFWIDPTKNTYVSTQTITTDSLGNETESKNCSSNADCSFYVSEYANGRKSAMHFQQQDEMVRKRVPIQTEKYQYDNSGKLTVTIVINDDTQSCMYILTYEYE